MPLPPECPDCEVPLRRGVCRQCGWTQPERTATAPAPPVPVGPPPLSWETNQAAAKIVRDVLSGTISAAEGQRRMAALLEPVARET